MHTTYFRNRNYKSKNEISFLLFRTEQKLHDVLETKSNSSSGMLSPRNMLSPRPSLANWSPFEKLKSKIKILENTKQEFKSKIEEQEKEKNELISHLRQSKLENQKLQEKVKDLGDSYEMFKTSMVSQEDPFVLRLALEQSRKDFTKVVEKVYISTFTLKRSALYFILFSLG